MLGIELSEPDERTLADDLSCFDSRAARRRARSRSFQSASVCQSKVVDEAMVSFRSMMIQQGRTPAVSVSSGCVARLDEATASREGSGVGGG